jgi:hypothetical protein
MKRRGADFVYHVCPSQGRMETPKAIAQPSTVLAHATCSQTVDQSPPWLESNTAPAMPSAPAPRRSLLPAPSLPRPEAVHWSIVALTLVTAASVLIGAYGGQVSRSRELLPVMIVTPVR